MEYFYYYHSIEMKFTILFAIVCLVSIVKSGPIDIGSRQGMRSMYSPLSFDLINYVNIMVRIELIYLELRFFPGSNHMESCSHESIQEYF